MHTLTMRQNESKVETKQRQNHLHICLWNRCPLRTQGGSMYHTTLSYSWMNQPARAARGSVVLNSFPLKIDVSFFFSLPLPWRGPCKDKSFSCLLETLALDAHGLDKVSSAAHSKYCMRQKDSYDNASSPVQLCYLNELCGIIIRLMPVQGWLGEEV